MKIATYNIWNKNLRYLERLPLIISTLAELDLDIIALQEVQKDADSCTADDLADALGFQHIYYFPNKPNALKTSGVAILSKAKAHAVKVLTLGQNKDDKSARGRKTFGVIEFWKDNQRYIIGTTWLPLSRDAQQQSSQEIANFITEQFSTEGAALIITGDMNNYSDDDIRPLFGIGHVKLADALTSTYGQEAPITWPTSKDLFMSSWQLKHPGEALTFDIVPRRIDYLLAGSAEEINFRNVRLFGGKGLNNDDLYPSDHFGIYAEIEPVTSDTSIKIVR